MVEMNVMEVTRRHVHVIQTTVPNTKLFKVPSLGNKHKMNAQNETENWLNPKVRR